MLIRPLTPEDADLFAEYFSGPHFGHAPHWSGCFCRFYHAEVSQAEWMQRTPEDNRQEAMSEIVAGRMKGYFAFDGDTCVGWCNTNDAEAYIRVHETFEPLTKEGKFGATMCYVIHPDYRGQGVARLLLRRAVKDYRTAGYAGMLALPFESKDAPAMRYRGTKRMYDEMGYTEIAKNDDVFVMKLMF